MPRVPAQPAGTSGAIAASQLDSFEVGCCGEHLHGTLHRFDQVKIERFET